MKVGEMPTGHFDKLASFVGNSRSKQTAKSGAGQCDKDHLAKKLWVS